MVSRDPVSVLLGLGTCPYCDLAELDDRGWCPNCDCLYCGTREVQVDTSGDKRCPELSCEGHYRRPTSLNRFGGRNV